MLVNLSECKMILQFFVLPYLTLIDELNERNLNRVGVRVVPAPSVVGYQRVRGSFILAA